MNLQEKIYNVITDYPLAALATLTEDGRPWVRYIVITGEKDLTIKFVTAIDSRKIRQIRHNPEVHITCGATSSTSMTPYLQIEGKARMSRDETLRNEMWADELKAYFAGPNDLNYSVGIVDPYRIEYYDMSSSVPKIWKR